MAISPFDPADSGNTPLSEEEKDGLLPSHLTTRAELNEFEQLNIIEARTWLLRQRTKRGVAHSHFLKNLHRHMFDQTWAWAGEYRKSDKNLGVHYTRISFAIEKLCQDVAFWVDDKFYAPDQIAIRFHHQLVWIHPFANGNGRHSRLAADLLAVELGQPEFSWGRANLAQAGESRLTYIQALKAADSNPDNIDALLHFARS